MNFLKKLFSKKYRDRLKKAKAGPVVQRGVGETVKDHKCPNCKIHLSIDKKVKTNPSFRLIFKYLLCSSCGYQKRIKI